MAKLSTTVHVNGVAYGPGKDVPDEIVALISNPNVWEGKAPAGAGSGVKPQPQFSLAVTSPGATDAPAAAAPAEDTSGGEKSEIPPKGGAGSGVEAWKAYAVSKDVTVADDASRDDVIAALTAANVPTE